MKFKDLLENMERKGVKPDDDLELIIVKSTGQVIALDVTTDTAKTMITTLKAFQ